MTTRTFGQDFNALGHSVSAGFAAVGGFIGDGVKGMTPLGRRFAVTVFGATLALSLGVATAATFRLPSEITDPAQPQDQTLAQTELPSETAARTFALENPPVYAVATNRDAAPVADAVAVIDVPRDDPAPTPAIYTTASDEQPAAVEKPASSSSDTADANN